MTIKALTIKIHARTWCQRRKRMGVFLSRHVRGVPPGPLKGLQTPAAYVISERGITGDQKPASSALKAIWLDPAFDLSTSKIVSEAMVGIFRPKCAPPPHLTSTLHSSTHPYCLCCICQMHSASIGNYSNYSPLNTVLWQFFLVRVSFLVALKQVHSSQQTAA